MLILRVRLLFLKCKNRDVERGCKGGNLNSVHLPKVAALFCLWHTKHVAKSHFVKHNDMFPLEHKCSDDFDVYIEDVLALVCGQLDQIVHYLAAQVSLFSYLKTRPEFVTPLDEQGC